MRSSSRRPISFLGRRPTLGPWSVRSRTSSDGFVPGRSCRWRVPGSGQGTWERCAPTRRRRAAAEGREVDPRRYLGVDRGLSPAGASATRATGSLRRGRHLPASNSGGAPGLPRRERVSTCSVFDAGLARRRIAALWRRLQRGHRVVSGQPQERVHDPLFYRLLDRRVCRATQPRDSPPRSRLRRTGEGLGSPGTSGLGLVAPFGDKKSGAPSKRHSGPRCYLTACG